MTEIERDQILLNLDKKVNQINSIIVPMQEKVSQIDAIKEKVNQIDSIIVPMQEKVSQIDAIQEKVNQIDSIQEKVNQIDSIQEKVNQIDSIIVPMQEKVSQIDIMQKDIKELKEETRRISKSVAFIEHDHGKKIDTLIDITLGYLEGQNSIKKSLNSHNSILDNYSDRIWNLESKLGII